MSVIPVDLAGVTRYVAGFSTMLGYWFEYPQSEVNWKPRKKKRTLF